MLLTPFTNCCQAFIASGFGHSRTASHMGKPTFEVIDKWLKDFTSSRLSVGVIHAILDEDQVKAGVDKLLLDNGFTMTGAAYGPGHRHNVYNFLKVLHEPKVPLPPPAPVSAVNSITLTL